MGWLAKGGCWLGLGLAKPDPNPSLQRAKLAVPRRQLQGRAPLHARLGAHRRARAEEQPHLIRVKS